MNILKQKYRTRITITACCISILWIISCEPIFEEPQQGIDGTWYCQEVHDNDGTRNYYIDIESKDGDSYTLYYINLLDLDRQ